MNPKNSHRDTRRHLNPVKSSAQVGERSSGETLDGSAPETVAGSAAAAADRQPTYSGGYSVIPPNESRRNQIRTVAQRGEETLQRVREQNRVQAVSIAPESTGGTTTIAEARQKQFRENRSSKLQKKVKQQDLDRMRRQKEEEELQAMKDEQRRKAERMQQRRQQEEQRRSQLLGPDHVRTNESFLQRYESRTPDLPPSSGATHTSSRAEDTEGQHEVMSTSLRDVQQDHRRVNSAFLDRLETAGRRTIVQAAERPGPSSEGFGEQDAAGLEALAHLSLGPAASDSDGSGGDDPECHSDRTLTDLVRSFPNCSIDFLEDILDQCGGHYDQAFALLTATLG